MTNEKIPQWLTNDENYSPPKGNISFADNTKKSALRLLSHLKNDSNNLKAKEANTSLRLFAVFVMIVLCAISKNFIYVLFVMSLLLVKIATMKADKIREFIGVIIPVLLFSFIILLPSVFMGNPKTLLTILGKIFVCTGMVLVLNLTAPVGEITKALKLFYIPDIFIFTLNITIKYILQLGNICTEMLTALKIRSIGRAKDKKGEMSGIMGTLFIKSKNSAIDTAKAMECRGFDGKYPRQKIKKPKGIDFVYGLIFIAVIGVFVYLEVIL